MRKTFSIVLATTLLAITACGGSSGEESSSDDSTVTTTAAVTTEGDGGDAGTATTAPAADTAVSTTMAEDESEASESAGDDSGDSAGGSSTGTVTIGGETYQFADTGFPGLQCMPSAFGVAFIAALQQIDESGNGIDGNIAVGIPFEGQEETAGILPEFSANVGDLEWIANEEHAELNGIPAGSSQVDSYEVNGNTITGTATFYERTSSFGNAELVVEEGTFEVTCGE